MKFNSNAVAMQPEILKKKLGGELFEEITLAEGAFTNGVCKAGSPIASNGTVANTSSAVGILYTDVTSDNPNATIIKAFAVVNTANCKANSGVTLSADAKGAMNLIVFE